MRHRSVEAHLKTFTSSIMDCLVLPLQDRIEEWKKTTSQLDKEHAKENKRLRQELKKRHAFEGLSASGTLKLHRKSRGNHMASSMGSGLSGALSKSMDSMEGSEKLFILEEMEKKSVRRALIEERSRFCVLVNCMRPVVEEELAMLQELTHLQEIMDALSKLTTDPYSLPSSSELVIADLKLSSGDNLLKTADSLLNVNQTPPSSPSSFGSRKSSMCSISSYNSNSSSGSTHSPSHTHHSTHHRYRSLSQVS